MRKDFLWAGATAANQYEGGYKEGSRGLSNADVITGGTAQTPRRITYSPEPGVYYPSHEATDFYHHWKEDIALFAELGLRSYRMSISWTRIYPTGEEEKPNREGIEFYHQIFRELRKYGIEPIVTLNHFDVPYAVCTKYHGWYDRRTIDLFVKFCRTVMEAYKEEVTYWITINEVNTTLFSLLGEMDYEGMELYGDRQMTQGMLYASKEELPEGSLDQRKVTAFHHQLLGSARCVSLGKKINPAFRFGCMTAYILMYAASTDPKDQYLQLEYEEVFNYISTDVQVRGYYSDYALCFLKKKGIRLDITEQDRDILKNGTVDYVTFSYYMSGCVSQRQDILKACERTFTGLKNAYLQTTDWGFQIDPVGLRIALNKIYQRYQIPVFVAENGMGAVDTLTGNTVEDDYRIAYLKSHIEQLKLAQEEDGVDVFGYAVWGFIDLVSAGTGEHRKRYGLIYVNKQDDGSGNFERFRKKSFYWYQKVIASNGAEI